MRWKKGKLTLLTSDGSVAAPFPAAAWSPSQSPARSVPSPASTLLSKRSSPKPSPKSSPKSSPKPKCAIAKTSSSGVLQRTSSKKVLQLALPGDIQLQLNESISAGTRSLAASSAATAPTANMRVGTEASYPVSLPTSPPARSLERQNSNCFGAHASRSMERGASAKAIDRAFALGARHGLSASDDFDESRLDAELDEAVDRCRMLQLEVDLKREAAFFGASASISVPVSESNPVQAAQAPAAKEHSGLAAGAPSTGSRNPTGANVQMDGCQVLDQAECVLGYGTPASSTLGKDAGVGGAGSLELLIGGSVETRVNSSTASAIPVAAPVLPVAASTAPHVVVVPAAEDKAARYLNKDTAIEQNSRFSSQAALVARLRSSASEVCRSYHSCVMNLAWMCAKLNREQRVEPSEYVRAFAQDQSAVPSFGFGGDAACAHHDALRGFFCDADAYSRAVCTFRELLATPELIEYRAEWFVNMLLEDVVRVQEVVKHWSKPIAEEQFSRIAFAVPSTA